MHYCIFGLNFLSDPAKWGRAAAPYTFSHAIGFTVRSIVACKFAEEYLENVGVKLFGD